MDAGIMDTLQNIASAFIEYSALMLLVVLGFGIAYIIYLYICDITQTEHAVRRNYPVIGRFRYLFEHPVSYTHLTLPTNREV